MRGAGEILCQPLTSGLLNKELLTIFASCIYKSSGTAISCSD